VLRRLCDDTFSDANIDQLLVEVDAAVGPAIEADPLSHLQDAFHWELERTRSWLKSRTRNIRNVLPTLKPSPVAISEILAANRRTNLEEAGQTDDWIELHNRSDAAVNLGSLYLSDTPAYPLRWLLPDEILPPNERVLIWCDRDLHQGIYHASLRLDQDGDSIGLYEIADGVVQALDFIRFGPQQSDRSIGRSPDGAARVVPLDCPSPGPPNDRPCAAAPFIRGDCNGDGTVAGVRDAIHMLLWAFLGAVSIPCRAACDVVLDGAPATPSDAGELLAHNFIGGASHSRAFFAL
jgi:hypothetical protein